MSKRVFLSQNQKPKPRNVGQSLTQRTLDTGIVNTQNEGSESFEDSVNKIVRYIVYNAGSNLPIKKVDIQKYVLPGIGKRYEKVMSAAINVLKEVYGFDLHLCVQPVSNKQYIVKNILPHMGNTNKENFTPNDGKQIIILLVLTHVFMSDNSAQEETLFRFLQSFELNLSTKHELFGNIKEFVKNDMVKQRYLSVSVDEYTRKSYYSWGIRAENEVSKEKLLLFVCNIYGTCQPSSWAKQFEMANKQVEEQNLTDFSESQTESIVDGLDSD